jgi:cell shape-determining protein MreC
MDALTNVVAVLILVLILVQADVSQKVQQFLDDLKPATPEEVIASRELVDQLKLETENLEDKLEEEPPTPKQIEEEKRQLALLEKDIEDNQELLAKLDELRKLEAKIRPERAAEQAKTVKIQEEIARLEALLDDSLKVKGPPPAVVT